MEIGDILVIKGNSFYSKLVRFFTHSPWTHVAICVGDDLIAEVSAEYRARICPNHYTEYALVRYPNLTQDQKQKIVEWCEEQVGEKYDWLAIFDIAIHILTGIRFTFSERKHRICTTLVEMALRVAGIKPFNKDDPKIPASFLELEGTEKLFVGVL